MTGIVALVSLASKTSEALGNVIEGGIPRIATFGCEGRARSAAMTVCTTLGLHFGKARQ